MHHFSIGKNYLHCLSLGEKTLARTRSCTPHLHPRSQKKLFALFITGEKILALAKSCTPHPHPPKNYLPCLSVGEKFLLWPNLALPPPPPKTICLVYQWGKNSCTNQTFTTHPQPPKTICLVYQWGKSSTPPPKGPKKCQMVLPFLVIVLTVNVIAALMVSRMKPILTQGSIYMCAFWQFVLRSMSKP